MYDLIGHREDEVRDEIMLQGAPRPGGFASATSLRVLGASSRFPVGGRQRLLRIWSASHQLRAALKKVTF